MRKPGLRRHGAVALGMAGWQATLITEIDMPGLPCSLDAAQAFINGTRRIAARQNDPERATRADDLRGKPRYPLRRTLLKQC